MADEHETSKSAQQAVERAITKLDELLDEVRNHRLLHGMTTDKAMSGLVASAERASSRHDLALEELAEQFRKAIARGCLASDGEQLSDLQIRQVVDIFRAVLSQYRLSTKSPTSSQLLAQRGALRSAELRIARDFGDVLQKRVVAATVQLVRQSARTLRDVLQDATLALSAKKLESVRVSVSTVERRLGMLWLGGETVQLLKARLAAQLRVAAERTTTQKRIACESYDKLRGLQNSRFLLLELARDRFSRQLAEHCRLVYEAQTFYEAHYGQTVTRISNREAETCNLFAATLRMSRRQLRRVAVKRHSDDPRLCYAALYMHERFAHVLLELELFNDFNLRQRLRPCRSSPQGKPVPPICAKSEPDAVAMATVRARLMRCVRRFRLLKRVRQPFVRCHLHDCTNRLRQIGSFKRSHLRHVETREPSGVWWRSSYVQSRQQVGRNVLLLSMANQMKRRHTAIGKLDAALRVAVRSAYLIERMQATLHSSLLTAKTHSALDRRLETRLQLRTRAHARLAVAKASFVFDKVVASVRTSRHSLVFSSLVRATRLQDGRVKFTLSRYLQGERLARNVAKCVRLERARRALDLQSSWLWARWTLAFARCLTQMTELSWLPPCPDTFVQRRQHLTKYWTSPTRVALDAAAQYALQRVADIAQDEQLTRLEFFRLHVAHQLSAVHLSACAQPKRTKQNVPARPSLTAGAKLQGFNLLHDQMKLTCLQALQRTANPAYDQLVRHVKQHRDAFQRRAYVTRVHKQQRGDRFDNMTSACVGFVLGARSAVLRAVRVQPPYPAQRAVAFNLSKWFMRFSVLRQLQSFVMRAERMLDEEHVRKLESKSLDATRNAFLLCKARVYAVCAGGSTSLVGRIFLRGRELLYVIALESGYLHHSVAETPLEAALQAAAKHRLVATIPQQVAEIRSRLLNFSEFEDVLMEIRIATRKLMKIRARKLDDRWNATPWSQRLHLSAHSQASSFTYCVDEMNDCFRRRYVLLHPLDYCFFARHAIENRIRVLLGSGGRDCYSRTIRQIALRRRRRISTLQLPPNLQHLTTNGYALKGRGLHATVPSLFAEFAHRLRQRSMFHTRVMLALARLDARNTYRVRFRWRHSGALTKVLTLTFGALDATPLKLVHRELLLNARLGTHLAIATGDGWHAPTMLPVERSVEQTIECMRVGWLTWTRQQPKPALRDATTVQLHGKLAAIMTELVSPWCSARRLIRANLNGLRSKSVGPFAWCSDPSLTGTQRRMRPVLQAVLELPIECKFASIIEPTSQEPREYNVAAIRQLRKQIESHSRAQLRHVSNSTTRLTCSRSFGLRQSWATLANAVASFDRRCLKRCALHAPASLNLLANCGLLGTIRSDRRLDASAKRECILQCVALARIFQRKLIREFSLYAEQHELRRRAENSVPAFSKIDALHHSARLVSLLGPHTCTVGDRSAHVAIRRKLNREFKVRVCSSFETRCNTASLVFVLSGCNVPLELRNAFASLHLRRQERTLRADRHAAVLRVERSLANQHWQLVETLTLLASCNSKAAMALARARFHVHDATYRNRQWHLARHCTIMSVRFGKRCLDRSTWHLYARPRQTVQTVATRRMTQVAPVLGAMHEELKHKFCMLTQCVGCTAPHCFAPPFVARVAATHRSVAALLHSQVVRHGQLQKLVRLKADGIRRTACQKGLSCVSLFEHCVGKALSMHASSVRHAALVATDFTDSVTHARLKRALNEQVKALANRQAHLLRGTSKRTVNADTSSVRMLLLWLRQQRAVTVCCQDTFALQTKVNQQLVAVRKTHLRTFALSRADLLAVDLRLDALLDAEHEYISSHFFKPPQRLWTAAGARIKQRLVLQVRECAPHFNLTRHVHVNEKHAVAVTDDAAWHENTNKQRFSATLNEMRRHSSRCSGSSIYDCAHDTRQGSAVQLLNALRSSRKLAAIDKRVQHAGLVENAVAHLNVICQLLAYNSVCHNPLDFQQRALQAYFRASNDQSMASVTDATLQHVYQRASVNRAIHNRSDTHQQVIVCCAVARFFQNVPQLQRKSAKAKPNALLVPNVRKSNKLLLESLDQSFSFTQHASAFGDTLDTIRSSKYLSNSILKHLPPNPNKPAWAETQLPTETHTVEAASRKLAKRLFDDDEQVRLVAHVRRSSGRCGEQIPPYSLSRPCVPVPAHSSFVRTDNSSRNTRTLAETQTQEKPSTYESSLYMLLGDKLAGHVPALFAFSRGDARSVFLTTLHLGQQAALKRVAEEEIKYRMRKLKLQPVPLVCHEGVTWRLQTVLMSVLGADGESLNSRCVRCSSLELLHFSHVHIRLTLRLVHEFIRCGATVRRSLKHVDRPCVATLAGLALSTEASSILYKFRTLVTHRTLNDADEKRFRATFVRLNTQKQQLQLQQKRKDSRRGYGYCLVSQSAFRQLHKMQLDQCERFNYMTIEEVESFCNRLRTVCTDADKLSELLDNLKMPSEARCFHRCAKANNSLEN